MKKLFKTPGKTGRTSSRFTLLLLLLLMAGGSVATYAQTIGIVEGLTAVNIRQGAPFNGWPTVEFPILITPAGDFYANRFYKFDTAGKLVDIGAVPKGYDASNNGWVGYCVQCVTSDFPQIYRAVTLNCNPGSVIPWKPEPYSDPTLSVSTNNCTTSEVWSNPLTWTDFKVPNQSTGGFNINRNVTLDVNYDATNKAIYCNSSSALTINSGVTLTSNSGGSFVISGMLNGTGQYGSVVNNGVVSPGGNGIAQFQGGQYTQNTSGTLNMQLASTNSFDKLYWTSGNNVLGGTLKVSLLNGFVPVANNSFNIIEMSYATYTGTFSNLVLPALTTGLKWKISYNSNSVKLTVVDCGSFSTSNVKTDAGCYGTATGSITVTPINGLAPFQYKLNSGAYGSANTFTGLRAGNYKVYLTDANGCTYITPTIAIAQFPAITGTATVTNASCYGTLTGSITVTPTTGTAPFTYRLSTGSTYGSSNIFNGVKAGAYYVYIKDANGCIGSVKATVVQPVAITGTFTKTDVTGCYGGNNGSLTVTPTTGFAPYQYKLNATGTYGTSNTFSSLKGATYKVYIKDANGCEGYLTIAIAQPTAVKGTATKTDETCPGAMDGSITITASGGTAPYTFRFGTAGTYTATNTFTGLKAGAYRVYIKDANGCSSSIAVTIVQLSATCFASSAISKSGSPVEENAKARIVKLSPNPSNNQFKLILPSTDKAATVRVLDVNGKTLYTTKTASQSITFGENFAPGVYLIEVRQGNEVKTLKAIKN